jgi:hypothetical protein
VPYPNPDPPPVPECPYSLCPKAAGTLQFAGGASTIEVESFSWEAGSTTVNTSGLREGGEITDAGRNAGGGPRESVIPRAEVSSPRDVSTGLATGRRHHPPIRLTRGTVDVTMPQGVCVAGSHYPAVTLRSGDQAYEMRDVTVASCTPVSTAKGKKDKARLDYMVVKMETVLITG